jgi:hypothetical protein
MDGTRRFLLAALALGAVVVPASIAQAISFNFAQMVLSRGPIRGVVDARQASPGAPIKAIVSLHGLKPDTRYQVVATSKACGVRLGTALEDELDSILYIVGGRTAASRTDLFKQVSVRTRGDLLSAKSVRVFELSSKGRRTQRACALQEATQMESRR